MLFLTPSEKKKRLNFLKDSIIDVNKEILKMKDKKNERLKEALSLYDELGIAKEEKFYYWFHSGGPKRDLVMKDKIASAYGENLFELDLPPIYPSEGETIGISRIYTAFILCLSELERPGVKICYGGFTRQDIYDWMDRIIELELSSYTYKP